MIWIFFTLEFVSGRQSAILRDSGGLRLVLGCRIGLESAIGAEKGVYQIQNFTCFPCMVDIRAQPRALPDAVREVSCKLFHLADRIPLRARDQHGVVSPHHLVPVPLRRLVVTSGGE